MTRISITSGADLENTSDPAASASSGGSASENPASPTTSGHVLDGSTTQQDEVPPPPVSPGNDGAAAANPTAASSPSPSAARTRSSGATTAAAGDAPASPQPSEEERLRELRMILPGVPDAELREMLRQNDRASRNTEQSANDARTAAATAAARDAPSSPGSPGSSRPSRTSGRSNRSSRGSRRSWQPCRPPPSRVGVFSVGGPIQGGEFNIGTTDPDLLEVKRIDAANSVQEALNEKLGYNLRESGKYEECERLWKEGETMLASTGLERREQRLMPKPMMWDAPPLSMASMMKREPQLDPIGDPLPLPLSFGGREEGGNGEIALGKFVDVAPDESEDEQKREEVLDSESWQEVSVDESPMGPYDHVVRCWKCRAGLKVHIEVGLVACPRCRTISPATEVAKNIG